MKSVLLEGLPQRTREPSRIVKITRKSPGMTVGRKQQPECLEMTPVFKTQEGALEGLPVIMLPEGSLKSARMLGSLK